MFYRQWYLIHRSFHEASFAMIAVYRSASGKNRLNPFHIFTKEHARMSKKMGCFNSKTILAFFVPRIDQNFLTIGC